MNFNLLGRCFAISVLVGAPWGLFSYGIASDNTRMMLAGAALFMLGFAGIITGAMQPPPPPPIPRPNLSPLATPLVAFLVHGDSCPTCAVSIAPAIELNDQARDLLKPEGDAKLSRPGDLSAGEVNRLVEAGHGRAALFVITARILCSEGARLMNAAADWHDATGVVPDGRLWRNLDRSGS